MPTSRSSSTQAEANYAAYVEDQSASAAGEDRRSSSQLYKAGDDDAARALYSGRPHALGAHRDRRRVLRRPRPDDGRPRGRPRARPEVDRLAPASRRTSGPQRAEDYTPLTDERARDLRRRPARQHRGARLPRAGARPTPWTQIANGSRGLLEEVATGKVTGEEEYWSRTDLWDFQANVDGAQVALRRRAARSSRRRTPSSPTQLDRPASASSQALLDAQREGDGFVSYDELTPGRGQGALRLRQRPLRAAVAPDRRGAVLTDRV